MPSDDYGHGQMMGMLVMIQLFENARDADSYIPDSILDTVKRIAASDLAKYLKKPEEDIYLLVDQQLRKV